MSRCTCNNPCTCYFEFDGDRPSTIYTQPYVYGRYNTIKKGSGTAANPYIIEFLDSEEYQVEAGQIRTITPQVFTSSTSSNTALNLSQIDYETPGEIFLAFVIHAADGIMYVPTHRFWFVSAQATFISNGSSTGVRRLHIQWRPPADNYGVFTEMVIAGTTSSGLPGAEDITLNCSGLAPFADFSERKDFYGPGGSFILGILQDSGSSMTIKDVIFTIVAL